MFGLFKFYYTFMYYKIDDQLKFKKIKISSAKKCISNVYMYNLDF